MIAMHYRFTLPADYDIANCSQRAVRFILSTHRRHEAWSGLRSPESEGLS